MADLQLWTAIAFLMLGIFLVVMEIAQPGFFIAIPGGTLFLGGALALGAPGIMFGPAGWFVWPIVFIVATIINIYAYKRWAPPGDRPLTLSVDSLPGMEAEVVVEVKTDNMRGKVRVKGGTWSARSEAGDILPGQKVLIVRSEGVHLVVRPLGSVATVQAA